jgi:nucleoside-diphosphate kinase
MGHFTGIKDSVFFKKSENIRPGMHKLEIRELTVHASSQKNAVYFIAEVKVLESVGGRPTTARELPPGTEPPTSEPHAPGEVLAWIVDITPPLRKGMPVGPGLGNVKAFALALDEDLTEEDVTEQLMDSTFADKAYKGFFAGLIEYMTSGPVVAMVWEGTGVVASGRVLLGATKPADSAPGTIRGDLCIEVGRNICHGSDSTDSAAKEIAHWFSEGEVCSWTNASESWIYE